MWKKRSRVENINIYIYVSLKKRKKMGNSEGNIKMKKLGHEQKKKKKKWKKWKDTYEAEKKIQWKIKSEDKTEMGRLGHERKINENRKKTWIQVNMRMKNLRKSRVKIWKIGGLGYEQKKKIWKINLWMKKRKKN